MAASALLKNDASTEEWPQVLLWNKERLYPEKNCFLRLNAETYKEKHFLWTTTLGHTLFSGAAISLKFLYICQWLQQHVISAFKNSLVGTKQTFTCSKSTAATLEKRYKICPNFTINKTESYSGVFTTKCFYCWLWLSKCFWRSSLLCKYYYPKYKDEQMLYLTSFKIAACFPNN